MNNKIGNYYQKSSFCLKLARYIIVLTFIVFLISCILIYRNDITVENIQFLAKYITLNDGSSNYYKDEFQINATDDSDIFMLRDNVVVSDKNGIDLYELSGTKLFNYDFSYSSPAVATDTHNILVYDIEGNELSIFNSFSRVFSQKFPFSVRCADINEKGFSIITNEKGYRSALVVYNSNFKETFRWLSEENYLSALSLSPNGKNVAVSTVTAEKGAYKSAVKIFDITKEEPEYVSKEFDELPLVVSYSEDGKHIYVITDGGIHFYDSKLNETRFIKFNQSKIENYFTYKDMLILTEKNNLSGNSMTLTALSADGTQLFDVDVNDEIYDIAIGRDKIFTLGNDCVYMYSYSSKECKLISAKTVNTRYNSILTDSEQNCYLANNSTIVKLDFNIKEQKAK